MAATQWSCSVSGEVIIAQNMHTGRMYKCNITDAICHIIGGKERPGDIFFKLPRAIETIHSLTDAGQYEISEIQSTSTIITATFRVDIKTPICVSEEITITLAATDDEDSIVKPREHIVDLPPAAQQIQCSCLERVKALEIEMRAQTFIQRAEHIWGTIPAKLYDFAMYVARANAKGTPITFTAMNESRLWLSRTKSIAIGGLDHLGWMRSVIREIGDNSIVAERFPYAKLAPCSSYSSEMISNISCNRLVTNITFPFVIQNQFANQIQYNDAASIYRVTRPSNTAGSLTVKYDYKHKNPVFTFGNAPAYITHIISIASGHIKEINPFTWDLEEHDDSLRDYYVAAENIVDQHIAQLRMLLRGAIYKNMPDSSGRIVLDEQCDI